MSNTIVIISHAGDSHAYAAMEGLRQKGREATLWYTTDFPSQARETALFEKDELRVGISSLSLDLASTRVDTVWNRRSILRVDEDALHPADVEFAQLNCELFRESFLATIWPDAFWINRHQARWRESKLYQHPAALRAGLRVPDTLYSNDPREIRQFMHRHGGSIIYKPLVSTFWRIEGNVDVAPYTSVITEDKLVDDDMLQAVPGIYQALVPKDHELRLTVMGQRVVGTKILSQQTESGKMDWRRAYHELRMEPAEVPDALRNACLALMDELGLVFGCFDIVVTPSGEYVFLEVNQMGQFLFLEKYTRQPLLDMFCEFLAQGRVDFEWEETPETLRFADIRPIADANKERDKANHVPVPSFVQIEAEAEPE